MTGSARKEHRTAGFQKFFCLPVSAADTALHILAAPHGRESFERFGTGVFYSPILVETGTENHAVLLNDLFRYMGEDTSRRTLQPNPSLFVFCRIYMERLPLFALIEYRTYFFAQAAIYTFRRVCLRIKKPFLVFTHYDAGRGAALFACSAAAAHLLRSNGNHFLNFDAMDETFEQI